MWQSTSAIRRDKLQLKWRYLGSWNFEDWEDNRLLAQIEISNRLATSVWKNCKPTSLLSRKLKNAVSCFSFSTAISGNLVFLNASVNTADQNIDRLLTCFCCSLVLDLTPDILSSPYYSLYYPSKPVLRLPDGVVPNYPIEMRVICQHHGQSW